MTAKLDQSSWLDISSTAASEAMPNFTQKNPGPWKSIRSNFGLRIVGNITSIGNYAFAGCEHLTTIDFIKTPDANAQTIKGFTVVENSNCLTSIGEGAFEGCVKLGIGDGFFFPQSLTSIGNYAFRGCISLKNFLMRSSLSSIGNGAFQDCTGLRYITAEWETPLNIQDNVFTSLNTSNITLYIPNGTKSQYENANVWKNFRIETEAELEANVQAILHDDNPVKNFQIKTGLLINRVIGEKALALLILSLSVILFIMRASKEEGKSEQGAALGISHILMRVSREKYEPRRGATYTISTILFLIICTLEILYVSSVEDSTWFCSPDRVGWIWTVINFFLFGGIVYNQILYLFDVMGDVFANGKGGCDLKLGVYTWIGGFIVGLLCSFFFKAGLQVVLVVICILQLIQAVLIFKSYGKNIKGAFWGVFVYLLGSIGTVVTLLIFLGILILVAIVAAVLLGILNGKSSGSSSSSSNSNPNSNQYCRTCKYYQGNGYNCSRIHGIVGENTKACFYWERD